MKQKLAILLALMLMLCCMAPAAWAAETDPLSIQISRDVKTKIITVSGIYQNGYGQMMTITAEFQTSEDSTVSAPDGPVYLNQFFVTDTTGAYSHSFRIPDESPIGTYLITITAADTGLQQSVALQHVGEQEQLAAVARLRNAANGTGTAAEVASAVGKVLVEDKTALTLDLTDYLALGSRSTRVNELVAKGVKQSQPQDVVAVYDIFQPAMAIASLEGCGANNVVEVLTKYQDLIEADLTMLDVLNGNAKEYAMNWLQNGSYTTVEEVEEAYIESVILGAVSRPLNYAEIRQALMDTYQSTVALDTTRFNQVKDQSQVFKAMLNTNYTSLEQVKLAFGQAVENRLSAESGGSTSGGSGGGGSSGGGGTAIGGGASGPALPGQTGTSSNNPSDVDQPGVQMGFSDMDSVPWAQDAVNTLYNKGIVKAAADGKFRPDDAITRAEFTALVVRAFELEGTGGEADFADVNADDWYYSVVAAAAANGIAQGIGGGLFNPDANISRQDMAVIIDRAAKLKGITFGADGTAMAFADADQIALYALEAVENMRIAGIINGNGDGTFAPQANATRAESAKMIAAVLTIGR